jgi:trk system potassium uptake protein TrkA
MTRVHVVIVGCGRVGSGLATRLVEAGHSVAVIDKLARAFRRLPDDWPGLAIEGSGFDRQVLERASAARASALAAVTNGDNSNILTARIARETYGIPNVVARIYDARRAEIYQRLGIPTVATVPWTIDEVLRRILPDLAPEDFVDPTGKMAVVERLLPASWAGRRLADLRIEGRAHPVALTRASAPRLDVEHLIVQEGDVAHFVVLRDALGELDALLRGGMPAKVARP